MNRYIAYCGLNCEVCEAYKATVDNDDALRARVLQTVREACPGAALLLATHGEDEAAALGCTVLRFEGGRFLPQR